MSVASSSSFQHALKMHSKETTFFYKLEERKNTVFENHLKIQTFECLRQNYSRFVRTMRLFGWFWFNLWEAKKATCDFFLLFSRGGTGLGPSPTRARPETFFELFGVFEPEVLGSGPGPTWPELECSKPEPARASTAQTAQKPKSPQGGYSPTSFN